MNLPHRLSQLLPVLAGIVISTWGNVGGEANGALPIRNDDGKSSLAVTDVTVREGNSGDTNAIFTVKLDRGSRDQVSVDFATVAGTASAPTDFAATNGTLIFAPGEMAKTVEVRVLGDTVAEPDQGLQLVLSNVTNAHLADASGIGRILNDDFAPWQVAGFRWDPISGIHKFGERIPVSLTAIDDDGAPVTNFNATVQLTALETGRRPASVVMSELDLTSSDQGRVEFVNVGTNEVDLSNWTVSFYDSTTWPLPRGSVALGAGTSLLPYNIFQISEGSEAAQFPNLSSGFALEWGPSAGSGGRHVAILLRDAAGEIVDFFCAMRAIPDQIKEPVVIPPAEWIGLPLIEASSPTLSYHRTGEADSNSARDWVTGSPSPNFFSRFLKVPFADSRSLAVGVTPHAVADFRNGAWTGNVLLSSFAPQVSLLADDGNGHTGRSDVFPVSSSGNLTLTLTTTRAQFASGEFTGQTVLSYWATVSQCCDSVSSNVVVEVRRTAYFSPPGQEHTEVLGRANLGDLPAGKEAFHDFILGPYALASLPILPTNFVATAKVRRSQPEIHLADNSAEAAIEINAGCATLPGGALAWWRGEKTLDDSLSGALLEVVGTGTNSPIYSRGRTEGASGLSLDRDRGFRARPELVWSLGPSHDFSVDLWLQAGADSRRDRIILLDKRAPLTGVGFALFLDHGRLGATLTDTAGNTVTHLSRPPAQDYGDLRDGRWHHVALVARRSSQVTDLLLSTDGTETNLVSMPAIGDLGDAPLRFGHEQSSNTETAFVGTLDEVTLYTNAMDSASLAAVVRAGGAGKCLAEVAVSFVNPRPVNNLCLNMTLCGWRVWDRAGRTSDAKPSGRSSL